MADHLTALRAAYPALTWTRRRRGKATYYTGRVDKRTLVVVRHTDGEQLVHAALTVSEGWIEHDYATDPVEAVRRAWASWITDAKHITQMLDAAFGGAS